MCSVAVCMYVLVPKFPRFVNSALDNSGLHYWVPCDPTLDLVGLSELLLLPGSFLYDPSGLTRLSLCTGSYFIL